MVPQPPLADRRFGPLSPVALLLCAVLTVTGLCLVGSVTAPTAQAATQVPAGLRAVSTSRSAIAVTWSAVKAAPQYRIQISRSSSMKNATYHRFTSTRAELTGLRADTTYYVKVRVITKTGGNLSAYSKAIKVRTRSSGSYRYLSPAGLHSTGTSPSSIGLAWSSRGSGIRYRVQYARSSAMAGADYVRTTPPSLAVEKLRAATTYWLKVRVIDSAGKNLSEYSPAIKLTTLRVVAGAQPLRVGSYNVKCSNCFAGLPDELPWAGRRASVVATIKGAGLDVVGLQEAGQAWLKDASGKAIDESQFEDLLSRLGSPWKLTNTKRNNCVKDTTPTKCVYADKGASQGTKIVYNSSRIELLASGSKRLSYVNPSANARYIAWAILRQRSTGTKFFFADTHLEAAADAAGSTVNYQLRRKQAGEVIATIKAKNTSKLPVVVVGDFNSHKWTAPSNGPYDVFVKAGYVDPLGNTYYATTTAPGATVEHRVRTYLNSFNGFARAAPAHPTWINGTYIDYILTSRLRVSEFETVANLDSAGRFVGVIPSDHNLIRATVYLK